MHSSTFSRKWSMRTRPQYPYHYVWTTWPEMAWRNYTYVSQETIYPHNDFEVDRHSSFSQKIFSVWVSNNSEHVRPRCFQFESTRLCCCKPLKVPHHCVFRYWILHTISLLPRSDIRRILSWRTCVRTCLYSSGYTDSGYEKAKREIKWVVFRVLLTTKCRWKWGILLKFSRFALEHQTPRTDRAEI